jgi:hypothetical protein
VDELSDPSAPAEMPQPVSSRFRGNKRPRFTFYDSALAERPALAGMAMQVIGIWSQIDADLLNIVTERFTEADFLVVSSMLNALRGGESQRLALRGAAQAAIPGDVELFEAVERAISASRKRRHEFAHGLWGASDDLPDDLLLLDPKYYHTVSAQAQINKQVLNAWRFDPNRSPDPPLLPHPEFEISKIYIYTEHDFRNSVTDALEAPLNRSGIVGGSNP